MLVFSIYLLVTVVSKKRKIDLECWSILGYQK
jgi:hypothetical protein